MSHQLNGRRGMNLDQFMKICTSLDVSADWVPYGNLQKYPKLEISNSDLKLEAISRKQYVGQTQYR